VKIIEMREWLKEKIRRANPEAYMQFKIQEELFSTWESFAKVLGDLKIYETTVRVTVNGRQWSFTVRSKEQ
jgi:hypothetical protein